MLLARSRRQRPSRRRRDRKKVEMLFAHLKRILRLGRLRLRGPRGAQFEFTLAAIAQNLRRLAKLTVHPPDRTAACVACKHGLRPWRLTCQRSSSRASAKKGLRSQRGKLRPPRPLPARLLQHNRPIADVHMRVTPPSGHAHALSESRPPEYPATSSEVWRLAASQ